MEVVVDGSQGFMAPETGSTFRDLFESLERSTRSRRRAVVALVLDGETLSSDRRQEIAELSPGGFGLLEVRTMDPFTFSVNTLSGLQGHLRNLERSHEDAMAFVGTSEYSKALEKLDGCGTGWDILLRGIHDVGSLSGLDFAKLEAGGQPAESRFRSMRDSIRRFSAAVDFKDLLRATELAQNELRALLPVWRGILEAVSRHVARVSGTAP